MGIAEDILIAEAALKSLITKYEQYFVGVEKREPYQQAKDFELFIRKYATTLIPNTMYKFRYTNLVSRYQSYRQHWNKILREIEEGRYSRERFRADLRQTQLKDIVNEKPFSETEQLYLDLLQARKDCHLSTEGVSLEHLSDTIQKQRAILEQKLGTKEIRFRIVVEDGKPKIKASKRE